MATLGSFKVSISPEVTGAGKVTGSVGKELDDVTAKAGKFEGIGGKIGKGLAVGAAAGAAALGGLAVAAGKEFASLEQNLGGADAVFQEQSDKIKTWAATSAANFGLSTSAALENANKMGALLQGSGIEADKAAEMTMKMTQRASDAASVMGKDLSEAMRAVEGAAKGNFSMMDNLGVPMTNASLNAYALSKGIDQTFESMEQSEKIGLAYEMFMERTANYEGNFVKENKTLAGSLDILKGSWGSLLGALGTGDSAMIDGAISGMITAIENFAGSIAEVLPKIVDGLVKVISEILPVLLTQIADLLPEVIPMLVNGLGEAIGAIIEALPEIIKSLGAAIVVLLPALIQGVMAIVNSLIEALPEIINELLVLLPTLLPALIQGFIELLIGLVDAVPLLLMAIVDLIPLLIQGLVGQLTIGLPALVEGFAALFMGIVENFGPIMEAVVAIIPALIEGLLGAFGSSSEGFAVGVGLFFSNIPTELARFAGEAMLGLAGFIQELVTTFPARMAEFVAGIVAFFQQLPALAVRFAGEMMSYFQNLPSKMATIGQDIIWGLISGIGSMWSNLMAEIGSFIDGIQGAFLEGLGIHSPSRWMRDEIGENMGAGVGVGLLGSISDVLRDVDAFNARVVGGFATDARIGVSAVEAGELALGNGGGHTTIINQQVPKSDSALDIYLATKRGQMAGMPPAPKKEN